MAAVDAVPAPPHGAAGGAVAQADDAPPSSFVNPATAVVCVAASALVSEVLSYYASLPIYLALFARAVWPDRVDAVLVPLGASARRAALLARADLEADLRRLRAHRATAPICAAAEAFARRARDAVDGARRRAEAKWAEHSAAAGTAWFLLRLAGRAARVAATVLLDAAREEVTAQAPSVIAYLKGAVLAIRKGEKEEEEEGADNAGIEFRDVVSLVGIAFYLLFSIRFILSLTTVTTSGMQFYGAFSVAMCGLAVLVADWIDPPDDDSSDDTTDDTTGATQPEGDDAGEAAGPLDEVRESWQIMHLLTFAAFCFDAFVLHVRFGPQPIVLLLLALCNFEVLRIGKDIELTPDNDEQGATEVSAAASAAGAGVDEAVDRWRWGAVWVFGASSVKVFLIYLVIDFYMAASSFLWLCVMADLLLNEEDCLVELHGSGADEDRDEEGSAAGSDEDVNGCVEEGADEASAAQHSDMSSSEEDEEEDYVLEASEDEEEDYVLEERRYSSEEHSNTASLADEAEEDDQEVEQCDSSEEHSNTASSEDEAEEDDQEEEHCDSSEEHDNLEEQQQEDQESSRGSSIDDGWDLVDVDLEMTVKEETGANRKSSRLFPWK